MQQIKHVYFIGIGGIGMSGLAEILLNSGYQVSGSDRMLTDITEYLENKGATIYKDHDAENLKDVDAVVYSSAINEDNPERAKAIELRIPLIRRAEMLAEIMRLKYGIAIAGTHGKTTTTAMCSEILIEGKKDPTVIVGGRLHSLKTNARQGKSDFMVTEADEYDRSFLALSPIISVITSIEADHLDCYNDLEDLEETFFQFARKVPFYGGVIACIDDPGVKRIVKRLTSRVITYSTQNLADFTAKNMQFNEFNSSFELYQGDNSLGLFTLNLPGEHNIKNAMAAIIIGLEVDIPLETIKIALANFKGVERRFELKGRFSDALIIDDYAHHPTEVEATLNSAKSGFSRRIIAVFQPHLYSRTKDFYKEFAHALSLADVVIVTDIYAAREDPIEGITGQLICDSMTKSDSNSILYIPDLNAVVIELEKIIQPNDMVITLGAGDIWKSGEELLARKS